MKKIDSIIIHCSATKEGAEIRAKDIERMHRQRGFKQIGYNYVICQDGTVQTGRPLTVDGAHCLGYNNHSIGICYIGGLGKDGKAKDTRTPAQKKALINLVKELCSCYDIIELAGHRDTSPDLNDNGIVEPSEWVKMCPCFDVREEFASFVKPVVITAKKK